MAARWRGKDGDLNAGNSGFLASNTPNEVPVCSFELIRHQNSCTQASFDVLIGGVSPAREATCGHGDTWLKHGSTTTEVVSRELSELVGVAVCSHGNSLMTV